jgi:hypothetical protein
VAAVCVDRATRLESFVSSSEYWELGVDMTADPCGKETATTPSAMGLMPRHRGRGFRGHQLVLLERVVSLGETEGFRRQWRWGTVAL